MTIRSMILLAVLTGSVAGWMTSQVVFHDVVSPIVADPENRPTGLSFIFRRQQQVPAHHIGKNADGVKDSFRTVIAGSNDSTVRLRHRGEPVALGVVISANGMVLTKLSELKEPLECAVPGGRIYDAQIVARDPDVDLALVQVEKQGLTPARWVQTEPSVGSWVSVPGGRGEVPLVVGIVSTPPRAIPEEKAILGIVLSETKDGPTIDHVFEQSIAARIGLTIGDVITHIDSRPVKSSRELIDYVSSLRPGAGVRLRIRRDGKSQSFTANLGRYSDLMAFDHGLEEELNRELSERRSGFPRVIQHDCILVPNQCGGPLVDLDGRVVGMNIARSGRTSSFALPTSVVKESLKRMRTQLPGSQVTTKASR